MKTTHVRKSVTCFPLNCASQLALFAPYCADRHDKMRRGSAQQPHSQSNKSPTFSLSPTILWKDNVDEGLKPVEWASAPHRMEAQYRFALSQSSLKWIHQTKRACPEDIVRCPSSSLYALLYLCICTLLEWRLLLVPAGPTRTILIGQ